MPNDTRVYNIVLVDAEGRVTNGSYDPFVLSGDIVGSGTIANPHNISTKLTPSPLASGVYGDASHIQILTTDASGRIVGITKVPMVVIDQGGQCFNVFADKYGVKGDGVHDDTVGLQQSINDAIASGGNAIGGTVWHLPAPPKGYLVTSSLVFQPQGSGGQNAGIYAFCPAANFNPIIYNGPSYTSAIVINGMNWSHFYGIGIIMGGLNQANLIGFDFIFPTNGSINSITMEKCNIQLGGTGGYHIGFRINQGPNDYSNMPNALFSQCSIDSSEGVFPTYYSYQYNSIGAQLGGQEAFGITFLNCAFSGLGAMLWSGPICNFLSSPLSSSGTVITLNNATYFPPSGYVRFGDSSQEEASYTGKDSLVGGSINLTGVTRGVNGTTASIHGNGTFVNHLVGGQVFSGAAEWTWEGGGGSENAIFFHQGASGPIAIRDVRCEGGTRHVPNRLIEVGVPNTANSAATYIVDMRNVVLSGFTNPFDGNGTLFFSPNCLVDITGLNVGTDGSGLPFGPDFMTNKGTNQSNGSVNIRASQICASSVPFTFSNGWPLNIDMEIINVDGSPSGTIHVHTTPTVTLTDGPAVNLDLSRGTTFFLPMASGWSSRNLSATNSFPGMSQEFELILQQPGYGGPCTVGAWFTPTQWLGSGYPPVLSTSPSGINKIDFTVLPNGTYLGDYSY